LFEQRERGSAVVIELPVAPPDASSAAPRATNPVPVPAGSAAQRAT
jgi:hypothetical protein